MSLVDQIKHYYDVSNVSIANITGTSLDFIKSVAIGRRSFDLHHIQPLLKLEKALQLAKPLEALDLTHVVLTSEIQEESTSELTRLQRSIARKKNALEALEQYRLPLLRGLYACDRLLAHETLSDHERKWVTLRQSHLMGKLSGRSMQKVWRLKAKIAGLEAELSALKQYSQQ